MARRKMTDMELENERREFASRMFEYSDDEEWEEWDEDDVYAAIGDHLRPADDFELQPAWRLPRGRFLVHSEADYNRFEVVEDHGKDIFPVVDSMDVQNVVEYAEIMGKSRP